MEHLAGQASRCLWSTRKTTGMSIFYDTANGVRADLTTVYKTQDYFS
jgi:hypothetical protein